MLYPRVVADYVQMRRDCVSRLYGNSNQRVGFLASPPPRCTLFAVPKKTTTNKLKKGGVLEENNACRFLIKPVVSRGSDPKSR